jgi:hypothetical protein
MSLDDELVMQRWVNVRRLEDGTLTPVRRADATPHLKCVLIAC